MLKQTYKHTTTVVITVEESIDRSTADNPITLPPDRVAVLKTFTKDVLVLTAKGLIAKVLIDRLLDLWSLFLG